MERQKTTDERPSVLFRMTASAEGWEAHSDKPGRSGVEIGDGWLAVDAWAKAGESAEDAGVRVKVERDGKVRVVVPVSSTTPIFMRLEMGKVELSTDSRELYRAGDEVDGRALYSLLQFGAVVPPYSMQKGVERLSPGYEHVIDARTGKSSESAIENFAGKVKAEVDSEEKRLKLLESALDDALLACCPSRDPVIMFSGGVDSGLIASRVAAMGWKEAVLANFSFGAGDKESELAEAMAKELGLKFVRMSAAGGGDLKDAIEQMVLPFADHSVLPTTRLARAVIGEFGGRVVLDGTAADAAFGQVFKTGPLARLYRLPRFLRAMAGWKYRALGLYRSTGKLERTLRVIRRSAQMPALAMSVAQNPLSGIAYRFDAETREAVHLMIESWIGEMKLEEFSREVAAIDVVLTCCEIFSQKAKGVFDASPATVRFPFLEPRLLGLAMNEAMYWPENGKPKGVLKMLLSRRVPKEMVYRPKSGFVADLAEQFSGEQVVSAFEASAAGVLQGIANAAVMKNLAADLRAKRKLPSQTYSFIWAAMTAELWMTSASK